jgi:hypothetical protein
VTNEVKIRIAHEVLDVALRAREKIIDCYNLMALSEQPVAQMRAYKTSPSRYNNSSHTNLP